MNDSTIALLVSLGVTAIGLIGLVYWLAYRALRKSKKLTPKLSESFWSPELEEENGWTDEAVRTRRLLSTTDAVEWTEEFMALFGNDRTPDWGTMVGWFANAIEVGRSAGQDSVSTWPPLVVATELWIPEKGDKSHELIIDGKRFPWHVLPNPQLRWEEEWEAHILELEVIIAPSWGAEVRPA